MNRFTPFVALALVAGCGSQSPQRVLEIAQPPVREASSTSGLSVPATCPVYAPGSYDVDTPEAPYPAEITTFCALDDTGATYGVIEGDSPGAALAVLPGNRELGLYIGFSADSGFTLDKAVLEGPGAVLAAFSAPTNVSTADCCAESHPEGTLSPSTVAVGERGWLISLGNFDGAATQVSALMRTALLFPAEPAFATYGARFYVNGAP